MNFPCHHIILPPVMAWKINIATAQIITNIIIAGMDAITHFTMKKTIDQNFILISTTTTSFGS